mmetsp:Transcript_8047/g.21194  ORF Transcript_8047/g.21194 Transcript_8047/m.21194 type:complete len:432 (+) Transcript_8047:88-1383(+)
MAARLVGSSHVQFKFKSSNEYDTLWFDGEGISLNDLKARILEQKKMVAVGKGGKIADFDLAIANAQTGDEYTDYSLLVPRNTALVVRRIPPHRKLTLASKHGTTELGTDGVADAADPDTELAAAPDPEDELLFAPAPAAAPKALAELAPLVSRELVCPLCAELFSSAVISSCCGESFCEGCAQLQLEREGKCASCGKEAAKLKLLPNKQLRQAVGKHREKFPHATGPPKLLLLSAPACNPFNSDAADDHGRLESLAPATEEAGASVVPELDASVVSEREGQARPSRDERRRTRREPGGRAEGRSGRHARHHPYGGRGGTGMGPGQVIGNGMGGGPMMGLAAGQAQMGQMPMGALGAGNGMAGMYGGAGMCFPFMAQGYGGQAALMQQQVMIQQQAAAMFAAGFGGGGGWMPPGQQGSGQGGGQGGRRNARY